ncbi:MAG: response regulator [Anaerolineales bacterium]
MNESHCVFFLVEDNRADADLIRRVLLKNDPAMRIEIARDGEEALTRLRDWDGQFPRPMIVLLDLKLPKINGLQVLQAIKQDEHLRILPVIVLTSSNQTDDIHQAYRWGANSYIVKAIDFDEFSSAINTIYRYWCQLNVHPE